MPEEIEKINEIFRMHEEKERTSAQEKAVDEAPEQKNDKRKSNSVAPKRKKNAPRQSEPEPVKEEIDDSDEKTSERDYRPVRQSREYRSGCLGGMMYFVFVLCVSIILACLVWMSAADVLALNKDDFSAEINLPANIFTSKTVDTFDDDGNANGTTRVSSADMDYVADELKGAGLIQYKWLFKFFCKISKADEKIEPGEYELKSSYDYRALISKMRSNSGAAATVTVTIPEGFTMSQIFYRLEENGVCSYDDLMEAAANENYDYSFLKGLESGDATRLEGFLFPDTYEFYKGMSAASAINKFLQNFHSKLNADMERQMADRGLSIREVLEIASLIEKEAANDEERADISSVINNRLRSGWTLGIDSSILYIHQDHEGAPTREMLEEDSPYNLRLYTGLTPTPICNPGLNSILAALSPSDTRYMFFALDTATGTHRFFETIDQFNAFVATQDYGTEG